MRRRKFILALGAALLTGGMVVPVWPRRQRLLGWASYRIESSYRHRLCDGNECLERLRLLGWERGRNLIVETRYTESRPELFASAAAELVALSPDVIVAPNSQAVEAAMTQTASVPIVMLNVADPVGAGFIKSLANPGSNVTGSTNQLKDVIAKHHPVVARNQTRIRTARSNLHSQQCWIGARVAGEHCCHAGVGGASGSYPARSAHRPRSRVRNLGA